jgi:hypothetical protein
MSAPDTRVRKQAWRHRPAMVVLTLAIAAAAVFFLIHLGAAFFAADEPATPGDPQGDPQAADEAGPAPAAPDAAAPDVVEPTPPQPPTGD